jgi:hypothetical protein
LDEKHVLVYFSDEERNYSKICDVRITDLSPTINAPIAPQIDGCVIIRQDKNHEFKDLEFATIIEVIRTHGTDAQTSLLVQSSVDHRQWEAKIGDEVVVLS